MGKQVGLICEDCTRKTGHSWVMSRLHGCFLSRQGLNSALQVFGSWSQRYRIQSQMSKMGLGGGLGWKLAQGHSGNVDNLQEASHRVCDWIPSGNPPSFLGWGSQYGQKRDGGSRDRRTLSRLEGCVWAGPYEEHEPQYETERRGI